MLENLSKGQVYKGCQTSLFSKFLSCRQLQARDPLPLSCLVHPTAFPLTATPCSKTCSKTCSSHLFRPVRAIITNLSVAEVCYLSLSVSSTTALYRSITASATMESMSGHNMDMMMATSASMAMGPTGTAMAPMASSTGGMSGMGGGMDMGGGSECKISVSDTRLAHGPY